MIKPIKHNQFYRGSKFYDLIAGSPLIIWYGIRCVELVPQILEKIRLLNINQIDVLKLIDIITMSVGLVFAALLILFVILRGPASSGTQGWLPRIVAFLGAFLGIALLRLPIQSIPWGLQLLSLTLMIIGISIALYGLISLGSSFSVMPEARNLVIRGPYKIVRHPIYLGEEMAIIGLALEYFSLTAFLILLFQLGFQLYRIQFEEQVLEQNFHEYASYKKNVKKLLPGIY